MIKSLLKDYGLIWTFNRLVYASKLKLLNTIPASEKLFEKEVEIKRLDLFDFNYRQLQTFLRNLEADQQNQIIATADQAAVGIIFAFSSIKLDYQNPINWHYNPLTKKEIDPSLKWFEIPDFDQESGDIKVVWEASRFTHFYYFMRAYLITGDKKYYQAFSNQLAWWLLNNNYTYGANFKCGQEASLRMINTLMAYNLFKAFDLTSQVDETNVKTLVELSYKKVLSNFFYAHKAIKNNHTFSELAGLIVGGYCSGDNDKVKKAYTLLDKEISLQFAQDGGYRQYSFNYQRFTLQMLAIIIKMSTKTNINISNLAVIEKSVLLMYQAQAENGDLPNYGSNDGALVFPLSIKDYRDFRPSLNSLYALITNQRLYQKDTLDEEMLWFKNEIVESFKEVEKKSMAFDDIGLYTLRHKEGFLLIHLNDYQSRPAHFDQLHLDLWHHGYNVFCDSGTYSYASKLGDQLALTAAHNTVKIKDIQQMNKKSKFLVINWTKRKDFVFTKSKFSGTMLSENGYYHQRSVSQTLNGYKIVDQVGPDLSDYVINFHTPCQIKIDDSGCSLYMDERLIAIIKTKYPIKVTSAYRSLYYLKREEINKISIIVSDLNKDLQVETRIILNDFSRKGE